MENEMNAYEMVTDGITREASIFANSEKEAHRVFVETCFDNWELNCVESIECVEIHKDVR
jgi:hypothetical protein